MEYINKIVDATTGEVTYREYTPEEIAEVEAAKIEMAERLAKLEEVNATKVAAEAKLAALGLTPDDLKALGLGTN
jgi:hypothetical protein